MEKIITFFNHKGGVGKTTQLYNLAWALSQKGKKVLMVDADSQCNLSSVALGEEKFEQHYINFPNDNIKIGVAPAFEARPTLIEAIYCPQIEGNENLFLLPGSFDISENETQLSVAINFNVTFLTMTNLPGSFYRLIRKCCEKYEIDYVLIDLNPGLSAINQTLLFSSNYFVIPCGVDFFSKQAINSLAKVLPAWSSWSEKAKVHFLDSVYPLPDYKTKMLGYTVNNYNIKNQKPAKAVQGVLEDLNNEITSKLIPSLRETKNIVEREDFCLAEINNFNTLQQVSHKTNKPVFLLTNIDTGNSGFLADNQNVSIESFKAKFFDFADIIINEAI
ncbi:MAG: ParA family protein [Fluviicola sp.]|jgi:chromosome partitioning protein